MFKKSSFTVLIVAVLLLGLVFAVAAPASAGPSGLHFKARYDADTTTLQGPPHGIMQASGIGRGSHLGKGSIWIQVDMDFTVVPTLQTGPFTITTASGSQLMGQLEGTATAPDASGNVIFGGTFTITGGTGRFEGASGSGTYCGCGNIHVERAQIEFDGEMIK